MAGHSWYETSNAQALRSIEDDALFCRIGVLVRQERENVADLVEHLMELDRRGSHIDRGYQSLFYYCVKELRYSEQAAYLRIRACRVALDVPKVLDLLRAGKLHLETIARLSPHLKRENAELLLPRAEGASKREVQAIVAEFDPSPPERDVITPVGLSNASTPQIVPAIRSRLHFTADDELIQMLDRLAGLLRHKFPDGRLEYIVKEAAKSLLAEIDRKHLPRKLAPKGRVSGRKRIVPQAIKRQVWQRDNGRCAYLSEDGRRCESRDALEYDHIVPWALGGASDALDNIRLLCRPHNQRQGRKRFGPRRRAS